ncbi:IbrB-like domain-containing protein [Clostridioides sp. ZZV15-6597]|uniref:IbrB-like domain-containing protein n=1 Tax=Clostridioides sp. ZZV15-6597 TaxID=2811500 RepID=UPI001D1149FC
MIDKLIEELKKEISKLPFDEKVDALNKVKLSLHDISPFKEQPVDSVLWFKSENIEANSYNPNRVATPEMKLLHESIKADGYTQPIVGYEYNKNKIEIVDGYHRNRVGKEYKDINEKVHNYLPVAIIDKPIEERMTSTIRHNRARGQHTIFGLSNMVLELTKAGWSDERICKAFGMEPEEVLKLKQFTGLKDAFINHEFSPSWEALLDKTKHLEEDGE